MGSLVHGILFDIDGTLLDSNDAHAHAFVRAFEEQGIEVAFARVRRLIGMGSDNLLPSLGVDPRSKTGAAIERRKKEIFKEEWLPRLRPFPGTRDLLLKLKKDGVKCVVATSAGGDELGGLLDRAGVADLFDGATSASDAEVSKPHPDIVRAAIERAGMDEGELVMIGDTPYDVEAARRAGVRIVGVRCGGWRDEDLSGADAIYDDPADIVRHYERSPLAR